MIQKWLENRKYLPLFLRDHDAQKDLFKCIHSTVDIEKSVQNPPNWLDSQCYVIDVFLWYMAKRGYTLQRCRNQSIPFSNLEEDLTAFKNAQLNLLQRELNQRSRNNV